MLIVDREGILKWGDDQRYSKLWNTIPKLYNLKSHKISLQVLSCLDPNSGMKAKIDSRFDQLNKC